MFGQSGADGQISEHHLPGDPLCPPGIPTVFGNPNAHIYHAMQSTQHWVWQKLRGTRVPVLDKKM